MITKETKKYSTEGWETDPEREKFWYDFFGEDEEEGDAPE